MMGDVELKLSAFVDLVLCELVEDFHNRSEE